jgi:hypothetical protein
MRLKHCCTFALTPPPVTMTPVTLSSDCPPIFTANVAPCWPPAG